MNKQKYSSVPPRRLTAIIIHTPVVVTNGDVEAAVKVPMANKVSGLEWSGVRYGNSIRILVSNMNPTNSQSVTLPFGYGLPASTPSVAHNTHAEFDYTLN